MPYFTVWPDENLLTAAGFGKVADIPVIFSAAWSYQEAPSLYLRERTLRTYLPRNARMGIETLTPRSRQGFADCIVNFLEWCELRNHDWSEVKYEKHILQGYQKEMSAGSFSATHTGLSPATINLRVQEVCNFLQWAHLRGLRAEFVVPTTLVSVKADNPELSHGHKPKTIEVRLGAKRPNPKRLYMPSRESVGAWLARVRVEKGVAKHLMAKLIIKSAIRREEAVQWRLWTLPEDKSTWKIAGSEVAVEIEYGAKGAERYNARGDIVGPSRIVMIPLDLAEELHTYRETKRLKFFSVYVKLAQTSDERAMRMKQKFQHLFLSDFTGEPVSAQALYTGWTEVTRMPFKGWSPHLGRHYWACNEILTELEKQLAALKHLEKSQIPTDWIRGNVMDIILLRIKPQLGHVDNKTTELYIGWAIQQCRGPSAADEYEAALEENKSK